MQDKEDDARLGLKSSALALGDKTVPVLTGFSAGFAGLLCLAGTITPQRRMSRCDSPDTALDAGTAVDASLPYYIGVAASSGHLLWQVHTADLNDRLNLTARFVSNKWTGAALFAGIVASKFVA